MNISESSHALLLDWLKYPIQSIDIKAESNAAARQNKLTKPPGSLGRLEETVIRLAGMQADALPQIKDISIAIFAADHGVTCENVSAFPQAVTREMIKNFSQGGSAISVLAKELEARLFIYNLGTRLPTEEMALVVNCAIAPQTDNFTERAAMSEQQLARALNIGREAVASQSMDLFIGGEMGIGNTTSATAIAAALLKKNAAQLAGKGTGISDDKLQNKIKVINLALKKHNDFLKSPLSILRYLGGFEIAALTGAYLTCAQRGIPVLVDGFICTVAALVALSINPSANHWFILSHRSAEQAYPLLAEQFLFPPLLDLELRLGEGSGAAVAVPLLRLACSLHKNMATFEDASVSDQL